MKLTTEHRKTEKKDGDKRFQKKHPEILGPRNTIVHTRAKEDLRATVWRQ